MTRYIRPFDTSTSMCGTPIPCCPAASGVRGALVVTCHQAEALVVQGAASFWMPRGDLPLRR